MTLQKANYFVKLHNILVKIILLMFFNNYAVFRIKFQ
jgi:hypothetical protein